MIRPRSVLRPTVALFALCAFNFASAVPIILKSPDAVVGASESTGDRDVGDRIVIDSVVGSPTPIQDAKDAEGDDADSLSEDLRQQQSNRAAPKSEAHSSRPKSKGIVRASLVGTAKGAVSDRRRDRWTNAKSERKRWDKKSYAVNVRPVFAGKPGDKGIGLVDADFFLSASTGATDYIRDLLKAARLPASFDAVSRWHMPARSAPLALETYGLTGLKSEGPRASSGRRAAPQKDSPLVRVVKLIAVLVALGVVLYVGVVATSEK